MNMKHIAMKVTAMMVILLVFTTGGCFYIEDKPSKLEYPSSFDPLEINDDTIVLDLGAINPTCLLYFDTVKKKTLSNTVFKWSDSLHCSVIERVNDKVYIDFDNDYYGDIIEVDIAKGSVKKLPFYDEYAIYFSVIDGNIWMDTGIGYKVHCLRKFNLSAKSFEDIETDFTIGNYQYGIKMDDNSYLLGDYSVLNAGTKEEIVLNDLLGAFKYEITFFKMEENNDAEGSRYFLFEGDDVEFGDEYWKLYRIDSFESADYEFIDELKLSELGERPRILKAYEGRLVLATISDDNWEEQSVLEYDLEEKKITKRKSKYPGTLVTSPGWEKIVYKNGYFWWIHDPDSESSNYSSELDNLYVIQMDPDTFEQTKIKVE